MIRGLTHVTLFVKDQDEALKWYMEKLGFEKCADQSFGPEMRWLTVRVPGQEGLEVSLVQPVEGACSPEVYEKTVRLIGQGAPWALTTDDCQKDYELLQGRGVNFVRPPEEAPWGIWAQFRDLYGNEFVLVQPK